MAEGPVGTDTRTRPRRVSAALTALLILLAVSAQALLAAQDAPPKADSAKYWQKKVDDLLASYRAKGEPVTWQDVLAAREKLPPDQNSAIAFEKAFKELESVKTDQDVDQWVWNMGCVFGMECSPQSLKLCVHYFDRYKGVFADLERAGRLPGGVYPYPNKPPLPFTSSEREMRLDNALRSAAGELDTAAHFDVQQGNGAAAATKLLTIARMSASFGQCWRLWDAIARQTADHAVAFGLENCLSVGEIPDADLARLSSAIEDEEGKLDLRYTFYGGRAAIDSAFSRYSLAQIYEHLPYAVSDSVKNVVSQPGRKSSEEWHDYTELDNLMKIASLPPAKLRKALASLPNLHEAFSTPMTQPGYLVRWNTPIWVGAIRMAATNLATQRVARAAIAVERYRMAHGQWPATLEETVPAFLRAVPIDPFSGKPVLYLPQSDGVVVYSVGLDGRDDRGEGWDPRTGKSPDLTFNLLNLRSRPEQTPTFRQEVRSLLVLQKLGMTKADMLKAGLTEDDIEFLKKEQGKDISPAMDDLVKRLIRRGPQSPPKRLDSSGKKGE